MAEKQKRIILMALLAVIFLLSIVMMVLWQVQYRQIEKDRAEAARIAGLEKSENPTSPASAAPAASEEPASPKTAPDPLPPEAEHLAEVDLPALREVNGDVVGWIEIPGTELSYPLMQGSDNQYYLNRDWRGQASSGGSLYLECTNRSDLSDFHTIVYGHRMRNDSMFGTLKYYNSLDFWREHPCVYIVLSGQVFRYEIFAAQEAGVTSIVYRLDIRQRGLEEEFLQYCLETSKINTGLFPEASGCFLTLSTCVDNGTNYAKRWVVHAVLQETWAVE